MHALISRILFHATSSHVWSCEWRLADCSRSRDVVDCCPISQFKFVRYLFSCHFGSEPPHPEIFPTHPHLKERGGRDKAGAETPFCGSRSALAGWEWRRAARRVHFVDPAPPHADSLRPNSFGNRVEKCAKRNRYSDCFCEKGSYTRCASVLLELWCHLDDRRERRKFSTPVHRASGLGALCR